MHFKYDLIKLSKYLILLTILSSLFYLSIFISNKLSLSFFFNTLGLRYENVGGSSFLLYDQLGRFIYKIIKSFGFLSFLIILPLILNLVISNKIKKIYFNYKNQIYLILINLLLFFLIPTKTSIISMVIILTYLILKDLFKKKYLFLIIFLNCVTFFIVIDFLKIDYRYKDPCKARQAVGVKFKINLQEGYLQRYLIESKNNLMCSYQEFPKKYSEPYLLQKKLYKND